MMIILEKLSKKLNEIGKDLKSLIHTNGVFDKDEKLLDNQDLCCMLHISPRTLQRYRSEGGLPFIKYGQKIYYKTADGLSANSLWAFALVFSFRHFQCS